LIVLVIIGIVLAAIWCEKIYADGPILALRRLMYLKAQHHRRRARDRAQKSVDSLLTGIHWRAVQEDTQMSRLAKAYKNEKAKEARVSGS
jgi:hypothetical protein